MAANILAPAAPQVYADKLVEDEEVVWSGVQFVEHPSLNGWVAHQKGSCSLFSHQLQS